jgi:hypothetical protein
MSAEFLLKVAAVLEETAKVIDGHDVEKAAAVKTARDAAMKSVADKYTEATGEEIPPEVFDKLSSAGEDVVSTVRQLLEKTAGSTGGVESLGRSSEKSAQKQPTTKREAADAAYERFGNFINS